MVSRFQIWNESVRCNYFYLYLLLFCRRHSALSLKEFRIENKIGKRDISFFWFNYLADPTGTIKKTPWGISCHVSSPMWYAPGTGPCIALIWRPITRELERNAFSIGGLGIFITVQNFLAPAYPFLRVLMPYTRRRFISKVFSCLFEVQNKCFHPHYSHSKRKVEAHPFRFKLSRRLKSPHSPHRSWEKTNDRTSISQSVNPIIVGLVPFVGLSCVALV